MSKILYIEDDEMLLDSIGSLLRAHDYEPLLALEPLAGLELLVDNPDVALVITDFDFGLRSTMKGHEVATLVRTHNEDIPVIIFSGLDRSHEAELVGALYVDKMDFHVLLEQVATLA